MDPHTQAAILLWILGPLVVLSLAWQLWFAVKHVSMRKQREIATRQPTADAGQPMRTRDMRTADIERVLQRAVDDIFRPV